MDTKITKLQLYKIILNSIFIQGSWSFKALIGLGFCYGILPIVDKLCENEQEKQALLHRHLVYFNSHPYFANLCLGAVAKLENDAKEKKWNDTASIEVFKERLIGPLGVVGDKLFWNGLKPFSAAIGVFLGLTIGLFAIPVFLLVYNIPHLCVRIKGTLLGFEKGFNIIEYLALKRYQKWFSIMSIGGLITTGIIVAIFFKKSLDQNLFSAMTFLTSLVVGYFMLKKKVPVNKVLSLLIFILFTTRILLFILT